MPTEISGSTGVNKIQDGTVVNADINSSAAIAGSKLVMPTGSVIQVVKYTGAVETASTANNTWVSTAANVIITPSSTSSKIYLSHTAGGLLQSPSVGQSFGLRIKRAISGGATSYPYSSDRYHYMAAGEDWTGTNWAVIELDSPSTTSAITYTIEFKKSASSGELRHCDTATWNFVAMEIA